MNKLEYYASINNTTTSIRVSFKGGVAKDIIDISAKKNVSCSRIAYILLLTALKYNFDSSGNYIPSQLSRSVPSEERTDNIAVSGLNIHFPLHHLDFLKKCGKELSCCSLSATAKKLISIALDYDHNDHLKFSLPQTSDYEVHKDYKANDFICIDFI